MLPVSINETREAVLFGVVLLLVLLFVFTRWHQNAAHGGRAEAQPLDDQVRDVRHRVANVEQQVQVLPDHAIRLRTMEREVGEVRGALSNLMTGQERLGRQLDMLLAHHVERERETDR